MQNYTYISCPDKGASDGREVNPGRVVADVLIAELVGKNF